MVWGERVGSGDLEISLEIFLKQKSSYLAYKCKWGKNLESMATSSLWIL